MIDESRIIFLPLDECIELENKRLGLINQNKSIYRWKPKVDLVNLNARLNKPKLRLKKRFKKEKNNF